MKIIVDLMGGDNAPLETLKGVFDASLEYKAEYILVGRMSEVEPVAEELKIDLSKFELVNSETVIEMTDDPLSVVRSKSDSSMSVGMRMLAEGKGDAFVSTGNTGALFTGATLIVRKVRGIQRAAIASVLPMNPPVLLLDSGANVVVTDEYLEQFAVMGSAYMKHVGGLENPRVGLLNNGSEECKGTELQVAAYKRLAACDRINFVGNIEGNKVPFDACDVLVADGFSGNILIKTVEGMGKLMIGEMKNIFYANVKNKLAGQMVKSQLVNMKKTYDANEYGGAPILGISKPVIKAHGSSKAKAFKNAIRQAIEYYESGAIYDIANAAEEFSAKKKAEKQSAAEAGEDGK